MTVAVAVTVMIAAVGAAWQVWLRRSSRPYLRVRARTLVVPAELRPAAAEGKVIEDLPLVEVEVRNAGDQDVTAEGWCFVPRHGITIWPPYLLRHGEEAGLLSCPERCLASAHQGAHRWYVSLDWLEIECAKQTFESGRLVRVEDLRACVQPGGDGRWVRARRWGVEDDGDASREPRPTVLGDWRSALTGRWSRWPQYWREQAGYRRRHKEISQPVRVTMNPSRITVNDADS